MAPTLKVTPVKGRPMLHWVGKKPLDTVQHYPAQLCESFGVENPPPKHTQHLSLIHITEPTRPY